MKKLTEWEEKYYDVTELYVLADDLLKTVEQAENPEAQLDLVEPLLELVGESADVLSEAYISLCEGKNKAQAKSRIEGALRKAYAGLNAFSARVRDQKNAALAVVKKIKRQLEQVIVNFMEFTVLSLDRIMQKQDVEEIKQRHAHLSAMLHGQSLQGA
ncbi:MAG: hypothetical protein DI582_02475 [Azospirillum brasilense]|nr:MAG: hypothetical protein DI582_02475 [Azospirillum brasilense]